MAAVSDASMRLVYKAAIALLKIWWFVRRPAGQGACVLLWHRESLLVVRLSYRRGLSLPGGGMKRGETPKQAAMRELEEEIGLSLDPACLTPLPSALLIEDHRRITTHFFVHHLDDPPLLRVDNREIVWARFMTLAELGQWPMMPVLHHCVTDLAPTHLPVAESSSHQL
ncbi:ADP-ribose pyrophosphatase YjhB, NUDIX family [Arboricoccus pini]|uniref:ADP-ribose pyrophosphatase YjhB, NUDIX family n=1 Tax=Arboricoccus pini TaxID=1963835 RepID=A0A212R3E7_9PROT|nr:NUDIX hydrolase [Arboricoccus pini]SNB66532.1 ADP-ribose pyrophosphatase YjhB, NUDIX family [Arboricoccus pini]